MANTFRNLLPFVVPRWLSTGDGEKVLFTLGMLKDAAAERVRQGLLARFPTYAGSTGLRIMGKDRGIPRGRDETNEHYAGRLKAWRYPRGHRVRGNAFALLEQVSEYFGGVRCWTVDVNGRYRERSASGVESSGTRATGWDWDTLSASLWSRFWIVIDPTSTTPALMTEQLSFGDPDLYGGALGDDSYSVGQQGVTPYDVDAIRGLTRGKVPWKPAGSKPEWVVVQLDGTDQTIDSTWENWSKVSGDHRIPSRYSGWRYWSLRPTLNNLYAGDSAAGVHGRMRRVDGTLYTPVAGSSITTAIPMPDGTTYNAVAGSAIKSIPLVDDGGIPV